LDAAGAASASKGGRHRDRGAGAIELAILLPVIVAALFAGVQVSLYFLARSEALAAAAAGVDAQRGYGAPTGAASAGVTAYLRSGNAWLTSTDAPGVTVTATGVTVTVTGTSASMIPGWHWHVSQTATGPRERLVTP